MDKVRYMWYTTGMKNTTRILFKAILMSCASLQLANCAGRKVKDEAPKETIEVPQKVKTSVLIFQAVIAQNLQLLDRVLTKQYWDIFVGPLEVDIDLTDNNGKTALMHAAAKGNIAIIKRLLREKPDLGLRDFEGKTAVIHAYFHDRSAAVKLLSTVGKNEYSYWTVTTPKRSKAGNEYTGRLYFDKPDGQGVLKTTGHTYEGEFKMGKYHGKGTFVSPEGSYTGDFRDGKFHGNGVENFPDGIKYAGTYKNGNRHGSILITSPDGRSTVVEFVNGKAKGQ